METGKALIEAGLHPATGGDGTAACSGDMLLEALVACAGVTLHAVATSIGVEVSDAKVTAEGDLDFRGTLSALWRESLANFARLPFAVRQAVTTDIPCLAHHRAAMFRDMGQLPFQQEQALERATASYLREAMPRGEYLAWVAEDEQTPPTVIGGAGVQLRPILPRPRPDSDDLELGPEAIVLNVYVEPPWRRRGVAEALMRAVLTGVTERGIRRIVLHASDEGRRLYERLGFVPTNEMRLGRT